MHKLALAAFVIAAAGHAAHAECGRTMFLGTPSGTAIPRIGSLYLYDERADYGGPTPVVATFSGRPGTTQLVKVTDQIERLDYVSFPGATLDVTLGDDTAHATYDLGGDGQPAPATRVLQYWHDSSAWTCSFSDAVMIQLDEPVAAVLARWTFDGVQTEWLVVPHTIEDFGGVSVVELGDLDCGAHNLAMSEMQAGGHLALTAIQLDGSRAEIRGLPDRIARDRMPEDVVGLEHALKRDLGIRRRVHATTDIEVSDAPVASPLPADWNPMRGLDDAMYAAVAGGALLVFACIALLRARPSLRDPNGTP